VPLPVRTTANLMCDEARQAGSFGMASIDYVVLTWNSAATLELTLSSIRNYGRPNRIIVVDKHSTDRTTAIAGEYGCDIISSGACLGAARRLGAREARTDLVAFVDSDVELLPEWEEVLRASVDGRYPDAGVIGALYNDGYLRPITDPVSFLGGNGAFGCSVTRRRCVLACTALDGLSSGEDALYAEFLAEKGLRWYILPIYVNHHRELGNVPEALRWRWLGAGLRRRRGFRASVCKSILGGAVAGLRVNGLDVSYRENLTLRLNYFVGYMLPGKYFEVERKERRP